MLASIKSSYRNIESILWNKKVHQEAKKKNPPKIYSSVLYIDEYYNKAFEPLLKKNNCYKSAKQ
jgi:hypothetical protein